MGSCSMISLPSISIFPEVSLMMRFIISEAGGLSAAGGAYQHDYLSLKVW